MGDCALLRAHPKQLQRLRKFTGRVFRDFWRGHIWEMICEVMPQESATLRLLARPILQTFRERACTARYVCAERRRCSILAAQGRAAHPGSA